MMITSRMRTRAWVLHRLFTLNTRSSGHRPTLLVHAHFSVVLCTLRHSCTVVLRYHSSLSKYNLYYIITIAPLVLILEGEGVRPAYRGCLMHMSKSAIIAIITIIAAGPDVTALYHPSNALALGSPIGTPCLGVHPYGALA
jgi:hypothetical protein